MCKRIFNALEMKYIRILALETLSIHQDNKFADLGEEATRAISSIMNKSHDYLERKESEE